MAKKKMTKRTRAKRKVATVRGKARRGAATRRKNHRRVRPQPDLMTRATRTLRSVADTAMGLTKTAIDTVRK